MDLSSALVIAPEAPIRPEPPRPSDDDLARLRVGPPDGLRSVVRFLQVALLGLATVAGGLVWDGIVHLRDPLAAHDESGPFDMSSPVHVLMAAGGLLLAGGVTGATVRARSLVRRRRRSVLATIVLLLALAAGATASTVALQRADDGLPKLLPDGPYSDAHPTGMVSSHADEPCRPSQRDRIGAQKLIADTKAGTTRFADPLVAKAEGYIPGLAADKSDHWLNPWVANDGKALNTTKPEALIYTQTPHGPVLTGVTYIMSVAGEFGPELGGCLTRWHVHANLCFSPTTQALVGELRSDGTCPPGGVRYVPPPALHVWFYDIPGGRFAPEIDHEALLKAVGDA